MKKHYDAEIIDQIMYIAQKGDEQLGKFIISFDENIDEEIFKQALTIAIKNEPIISCRFYERFFTPVWEVIKDFSVEHILNIKTVEGQIEKHIEAFINQGICIDTHPPINMILLKNNNADYFCMVYHHCVSDGTGCFSFVKRLFDTYCSIKYNFNFMPPDIQIDRSVNSLFKFGFFRKIKLIRQLGDIIISKSIIAFPWNKSSEEKQIIVNHQISTDVYRGIVEYCRNESCKINDYILTAFYKAFFETSRLVNNVHNEANNIFLTVDFRNYIRKHKAIGLCNYSSGVVLNIECGSEQPFKAILNAVKKATGILKIDLKGRFDDYIVPGLSTVYLSKLFLPVIPFKLLRKFTFSNHPKMEAIPRVTFVEDFNSMMNNKEKLKVTNAYYMPSLTHKPSFHLIVQRVNQQLRFSIGFFGNEKDKEYVEFFYNLLDKNLIENSLCIVDKVNERPAN